MPFLQQCDHCRLIQQSDKWPANDDGVLYCPVCKHDESGFIAVDEDWQVIQEFMAICHASWSRRRMDKLTWHARHWMGPYDPMYIRSIDR